jgi:DNA-binding response OmpR family regulator
MRYYLSIEESTEAFELYRVLWNKLGLDGIRVGSMTDGIEKAIEIEKSKSDELYFIAIAAGGMDYMTQLKILSEESDAPILVATSSYSDEEHHQALINGADYYGMYSDIPEQNVKLVNASINSIDRRQKKEKLPSRILIYNGILLSPSYRNTIFVNGKEVGLYKIEFDILYYMIKRRGQTLLFEQIYRNAWHGSYDDAAKRALWAAMGRLRDKLKLASGGTDYFESVRDIGYAFLMNPKQPMEKAEG